MTHKDDNMCGRKTQFKSSGIAYSNKTWKNDFVDILLTFCQHESVFCKVVEIEIGLEFWSEDCF